MLPSGSEGVHLEAPTIVRGSGGLEESLHSVCQSGGNFSILSEQSLCAAGSGGIQCETAWGQLFCVEGMVGALLSVNMTHWETHYCANCSNIGQSNIARCMSHGAKNHKQFVPQTQDKKLLITLKRAHHMWQQTWKETHTSPLQWTPNSRSHVAPNLGENHTSYIQYI